MRVLGWMLCFVTLGCDAEDKASVGVSGSTATVDSAEPDSDPDPDPEETGQPPGPCDGLPEVTWNGWAQGFFRGYCTSCHSVTAPDRWGAPEGINFDTEADVVALKHQIQSSVLDSSRMPVGGGVIESDLELLQIYLSCGM